MITSIGSQNREPLNESGYHMHKRISRKEIILEKDDIPGDYELWYKNDNHAGYVIVVDGAGYEFVRSVPRNLEEFVVKTHSNDLGIIDLRSKIEWLKGDVEATLKFPVSRTMKNVYEGKIIAYNQILKLLEAAGK